MDAKEESLNFANFLNTQRYKEAHYLNIYELEEMYEFYLESLAKGSYEKITII